MNIGERIKLFRKRANLTQKELGEKLNVTGTTITRYEKNLRTPDILTLKKIAEVFNISLNTLLTSNDNQIDELIKDILDYFFDSYDNIIRYCPEQDIFENVFGFKQPENNKFSEDELTLMLTTILSNDLDEFIHIVLIHYELILSFSNFNIYVINDALKDFNLSLEELKSSISSNNTAKTPLQLHETQNNINHSVVLDSLQTILNYIKNTSNQKILKNLVDYNLNSEKQLVNEILHCLEEKLLIHAINKGDLSIKINSIEGDNNDNKKS